MPVRSPAFSSPALGAGLWCPGCAAIAEMASFSLAHTDIYWFSVAELTTCNETALCRVTETKSYFLLKSLIWVILLSILQPISACYVMASCTGVLLPRRPASPHRTSVSPSLLVLWSQWSYSGRTTAFSSLSSVWSGPIGVLFCIRPRPNHSMFHTTINPSDSSQAIITLLNTNKTGGKIPLCKHSGDPIAPG